MNVIAPTIANTADAFARWLDNPDRRSRDRWPAVLAPQDLEELAALTCRFLHPDVSAYTLAQALGALLVHHARVTAEPTVLKIELGADQVEELKKIIQESATPLMPGVVLEPAVDPLARDLAETLAAAYPHLPTDPEMLPECTPASVVIASVARDVLDKARARGLLGAPLKDLVDFAASPSSARVSVPIEALEHDAEVVGALRQRLDALRLALGNFANPKNWIDAPGCLQWVGKRHAVEFAESVLAETAGGWSCLARSGSTGANDPQECDWPVCGCDPHATKVLAALEESGFGAAQLDPKPLTLFPAGTRPVVRSRLNGTVEVVDAVEDAPLLTVAGHNGADLGAFTSWLDKMLAQALGLRPAGMQEKERDCATCHFGGPHGGANKSRTCVLCSVRSNWTPRSESVLTERPGGRVANNEGDRAVNSRAPVRQCLTCRHGGVARRPLRSERERCAECLGDHFRDRPHWAPVVSPAPVEG